MNEISIKDFEGKDPEQVIGYLLKELKKMRATIRSLKEDRHMGAEQYQVRKAERAGELPYIPLPGESDI